MDVYVCMSLHLSPSLCMCLVCTASHTFMYCTVAQAFCFWGIYERPSVSVNVYAFVFYAGLWTNQCLCVCLQALYWAKQSRGCTQQITALLPIFQHITSSRAGWGPIMKGPALAQSWVSTALTQYLHPPLHFSPHRPVTLIYIPRGLWSCMSSHSSSPLTILRPLSLLPVSTTLTLFVFPSLPCSCPSTVFACSSSKTQHTCLCCSASCVFVLCQGTNSDNLDQRGLPKEQTLHTQIPGLGESEDTVSCLSCVSLPLARL